MFRHWCPDWDFDLVVPGSVEAECCTCSFTPLWFWGV